jgi:muramoyltetrapeptide carboxypeptidase
MLPPLLSPGDRIAVVAPSSPVPRLELWRGLAWLGQRYRLCMRTRVLSAKGYLAGDDEARADDLARWMRDPAIKAIVVARGGYGLTRILDRLPWDDLVRAPKWITGFSDVTALHAKLASLGVASVHAPNVTGLGRAHPLDRLRFLQAMEHGRTDLGWKLDPLRRGSAEGPLAGGNLALLAAMAATGMVVVPPGSIVVLEDVTERPYRIDRMLTSLLSQLARASAIVLGDFTQCDPGPDGVTAMDVLRELAARLPIPIAMGAPVGHGERNEAFVLGARAHLRDDGTLQPRG